MPRMPKPLLWWSDGNKAISSALTNKEVWLYGSGVRQPAPFQIRRRNLLTRIPRLGQGRFGTWVTDIPTEYLGNGEMRSQFPWQATYVSFSPGSSEYFFTDNNEGVSGSLTVSNMPNVKWRQAKHGEMALNPKLDLGGYIRAILGRFKRDYEFTIEGELIAPQDPDVEITLLEPGTSELLLRNTAQDILFNEFGRRTMSEPRAAEERDPQYDELWGLATHKIQPLVEDMPQSYRHTRYLASAMRLINSYLGRRYVDFAIRGSNRFTVNEDKPYPISITLRGDGPVKLLFALQVRNTDTGTTSISEFMPVVVKEPPFY